MVLGFWDKKVLQNNIVSPGFVDYDFSHQDALDTLIADPHLWVDCLKYNSRRALGILNLLHEKNLIEDFLKNAYEQKIPLFRHIADFIRTFYFEFNELDDESKAEAYSNMSLNIRKRSEKNYGAYYYYFDKKNDYEVITYNDHLKRAYNHERTKVCELTEILKEHFFPLLSSNEMLRKSFNQVEFPPPNTGLLGVMRGAVAVHPILALTTFQENEAREFTGLFAQLLSPHIAAEQMRADNLLKLLITNLPNYCNVFYELIAVVNEDEKIKNTWKDSIPQDIRTTWLEKSYSTYVKIYGEVPVNGLVIAGRHINELGTLSLKSNRYYSYVVDQMFVNPNLLISLMEQNFDLGYCYFVPLSVKNHPGAYLLNSQIFIVTPLTKLMVPHRSCEKYQNTVKRMIEDSPVERLENELIQGGYELFDILLQYNEFASGLKILFNRVKPEIKVELLKRYNLAEKIYKPYHFTEVREWINTLSNDMDLSPLGLDILLPVMIQLLESQQPGANELAEKIYSHLNSETRFNLIRALSLEAWKKLADINTEIAKKLMLDFVKLVDTQSLGEFHEHLLHILSQGSHGAHFKAAQFLFAKDPLYFVNNINEAPAQAFYDCLDTTLQALAESNTDYSQVGVELDTIEYRINQFKSNPSLLLEFASKHKKLMSYYFKCFTGQDWAVLNKNAVLLEHHFYASLISIMEEETPLSLFNILPDDQLLIFKTLPNCDLYPPVLLSRLHTHGRFEVMAQIMKKIPDDMVDLILAQPLFISQLLGVLPQSQCMIKAIFDVLLKNKNTENFYTVLGSLPHAKIFEALLTHQLTQLAADFYFLDREFFEQARKNVGESYAQLNCILMKMTQLEIIPRYAPPAPPLYDHFQVSAPPFAPQEQQSTDAPLLFSGSFNCPSPPASSPDPEEDEVVWNGREVDFLRAENAALKKQNAILTDLINSLVHGPKTKFF